jgi:hypothetical protein
MSHEPTLATRAWGIAERHVPHFTTLYGPARNAILTAITAALRAPQPRNTPVSTPSIDPRTGRPVGDHGSAEHALDYALDVAASNCEVETFLTAWREGSLEEWPEFYAWLREREAGDAALAA